MIIVTPLLAIIETEVEELNLKISIKAVNLGNVSDEKLETHVSQNFLLGTRLKFGSKMKNGFRSSKNRFVQDKSSLQLTNHTEFLSGEYK